VACQEAQAKGLCTGDSTYFSRQYDKSIDQTTKRGRKKKYVLSVRRGKYVSRTHWRGRQHEQNIIDKAPIALKQ